MRLTDTHRARRRSRAALEPRPAPPVRALGLGLDAGDLEEVLVAIGEREDFATADVRARLARARHALERELAAL